MILLFATFLVWPVPTSVTVVLLLPAAALLFPIYDSERLSERTVWRAFAGYCAAAFGVILVVVATLFPVLFATVLLFPFFSALMVFAREALPP